MDWPTGRDDSRGKVPIICLAVVLATLVVLVLIDVMLGDVPRTEDPYGNDVVLGTGFLVLLVLGAVGAWSFVQAVRDGREERRRCDAEDPRGDARR